MKNEWNMTEDDCDKYAKDCAELRKNCEESKRLNDATPAEWNKASKTAYGKLHHPEDPAIQKQIGGNHYNRYAIQPVDFIIANNLDWCEANAVKYITRWKDKNGVEDIKKAMHYLEILLERVQDD